MENQQQQPQNTPLCRANCGFYGSPATEDLCSKCFKDMIQRKQTAPTAGNNTNSTQRHGASSAGNNNVILAASTSVPKEADQAATIEDVLTTLEPNREKPASGSDSGKADGKSPGEASTADVTTASQISLADEEAGSNNNNNDDQRQQQQKKKNRCQFCNKRVGLTGFECRCGGLFCAVHRYDTAHNCTYDYKTSGREQLRKNNPQVISDKIQPI